MYIKCGTLVRSQQVLDELPAWTVASWNSLITEHIRSGRGKDALNCFHQMQREGLSPNVTTYTWVLRACGITCDLPMGKSIHNNIASKGLLRKEVILGDALVDMYVKCRQLGKAKKVLDELPVRSIYSWTALIAGYARHGHGKDALACFFGMQREGFFPSSITYTCILKACSITQDINMGKKIHNEIINKGLLKQDMILGAALVEMYLKCGAFSKAQEAFDELPARSVVSWNAMIAGYAKHGHGQEALNSFHQMREEGLSPSTSTYICILRVCGIIKNAEMGKNIHDDIVSQGLLKADIMLGTALVDMYAKCGVLMKAQAVFDELLVQDVVSWNALISGYVFHGLGQEALGCFHQMQRKGISPDTITYDCTLRACGITEDIDMGQRIHHEIASEGLLQKDIMLGNALVYMYANCAQLMKAQIAFESLPVRDVVSWSTLIAGYARYGHGREALECFSRMQRVGLMPNAVTYTCLLKSCGITEDIALGKKIHKEIISQDLLRKDVLLGPALVDTYAKCGALIQAKDAFDKLPIKDVISCSALIAGYANHGQGQEALKCFQWMQSQALSPNAVSWNSLIGGYAQQGLAKEALDCFQWMQLESALPNAITFINVLNACSHSGLVDEGQMIFDKMSEVYGIMPEKEHHTCMVDLFGRARLFDKAMKITDAIPFIDDSQVWPVLIGLCQTWGNKKLGRLAFDCGMQLVECDAAMYISMSNIYAQRGTEF